MMEGRARSEAGRRIEQCEQGGGQDRLRDTGDSSVEGRSEVKAKDDKLCFFFTCTHFPFFYFA